MLSWIKQLCGLGRGSSKAGSYNSGPARLEQLLKESGKAQNASLLAFANSVSEQEFIDTVACASLVGSAIRNGQIGQPVSLAQGTSSFQTFIFSAEQVDAVLRGASIEQSIFLLRKDPGKRSGLSYTQFAIGRAKDSDIRIVDFALSRSHACIEIQGEGFAIRDSGSRNGTRVNGVRITTNLQPLKDGDTVTLGRYDFSFLTPSSLYKRLRHTAQGK